MLVKVPWDGFYVCSPLQC